MGEQLPACPYCGATGGFVIHALLTVPVMELFTQSGVYVEAASNDPWAGRRSRNVVRCFACRKIRRDVALTEKGLRAKEEAQRGN